MGFDNPLHIAFLVIILLLVFGARRLPDIGRALGGGMREFKQSVNGETERQPLTHAAAPVHAPIQQTVLPQQPAGQPTDTHPAG